MFDARVVCIAVGADEVSGFVDAEQIGETEVGAGRQVFIVEAGFEAGHERAAGLDIVADLLALAVAKHGDVGEEQDAVFAEVFGVETVFVHVVEGKAAAEECLVHAVGGFAHVGAGLRCGRAFVEKLRALSHDDADVGDGAAGRRWASCFADHWK